MRKKITYLIPIWHIEEAIKRLDKEINRYHKIDISYKYKESNIFYKVIIKFNGKKEITQEAYNRIQETIGEY